MPSNLEDLRYIDAWSPLLDLKILFKTVPARHNVFGLMIAGAGSPLFRKLSAEEDNAIVAFRTSP